jgi:predicted peptidase
MQYLNPETSKLKRAWSALTWSFLMTFAVSAQAQNNYELVTPLPDVSAINALNQAKLKEVAPDAFSAGNFVASNTVSLVYRLLTPATGHAKKYPLVVIMHGSGAIGNDNQKQMNALVRSWAHPDVRTAFPAYVLAPQVPTRSANYSPSRLDAELMSIGSPTLVAVLELVKQTIRQQAIDPDRVYIVGFSMGASAAWNALLMQPKLFAAAVPFSGIAPERHFARELSGTPILIVHGNADTENTIGADQKMFAALQTQATASARFREMAGLNHSIAPEMLFAHDWRHWLFTQRRADHSTN